MVKFKKGFFRGKKVKNEPKTYKKAASSGDEISGLKQ